MHRVGIQRGRIAAPLDFQFARAHRPRDIGHQHQFQIDLDAVTGTGGRGSDKAQGRRKQGTKGAHWLRMRGRGAAVQSQWLDIGRSRIRPPRLG
ncbi:hypothetical protein GCM10008966_02350 [Rhodovulum strictum]